eukprot:gene2169-2207_t
MKPPEFAYHRPETIDEAVSLLATLENARPLAGGQSLMPMLAMRFAFPDHLIDLNRVVGLDGITRDGDTLRIGAMTRQRDLLDHPVVRSRVPLLAEALALVGHRQTRNRGTIGGSLCHLDPAAELVSVMTALEAIVEIAGPGGRREVAMADFPLGYMTPSMAPEELVIALRFTLPPPSHGAAFLEFSRRHGDFAIVSAGVMLDLDGSGRIAHAVVTLGGVGAVPLRLVEAEAGLQGHAPDAALFATVSECARAIDAMEDALVPAWYRRRLAVTLTRRALDAAEQNTRVISVSVNGRDHDLSVPATGRGPYEHVSVRIEPSGRIFVATGAAAMGQGTETMLAQIVAEQLGADLSNVVVTTGDTAAAPAGIGGSNSRQAVMAGSSAHAAAVRLRERVLDIAGELMEVSPTDLDIVGREVQVKGVPQMGRSLADIARSVAGQAGFVLPGKSGPGLATSEELHWNRGIDRELKAISVEPDRPGRTGPSECRSRMGAARRSADCMTVATRLIGLHKDGVDALQSPPLVARSPKFLAKRCPESDSGETNGAKHVSERYDDIGRRLKAFRLGSGLSAEEVAKQAGISRTALYRLERGELVKIETLEKLADLLDVSVTTLLGVGIEYIASAVAYFERLRQIEETVEHITVIAGPISFLLASPTFVRTLDLTLRESVPADLPDRDRAFANIARIMEVLRERKATYEMRQPSIVNLMSGLEIDRFVRNGMVGRHDLPEEVRRERRALAREEITHFAKVIEDEAIGIQIGIVPGTLPHTGFQIFRQPSRQIMTISPFRLGEHPNVQVGVAMITSAPEALALHRKAFNEMWKRSIKGTEAVRFLRGLLENSAVAEAPTNRRLRVVRPS